MFEKSKTAEMQRLRAAGFSVANADRLSRSQRGPDKVIMASSVAALLLLGGIVAISFDMTRTVETAQKSANSRTTAQPSDVAQATDPAAVRSVVAQAVPTAVETAQVTETPSEPLGASTLRALRQNRLSQSLAVQEAAERGMQTDQITRASSGISATLDTLTTAAVNFGDTSSRENTTQAIEVVQTDCVAELANLVRDVKVPFSLASAKLPSETAPALGAVVESLNSCDAARLMITGHSDSTGPEIANIQISWQRADATMSQLVSMGAATDQLEVLGFGTRVPVAPDVAANAPENRRVDFRVVRREETQG